MFDDLPAFAETFTFGPGLMAGADLTVSMAPMRGAGRVRVSVTLMHVTRSGNFTAGELSRLREQIDAALAGLA
jgi:hypothetical protein